MFRPRTISLLSLLLIATSLTGCQQLARRSSTPTPTPIHDATPTETVTPVTPSAPDLSPIPPLPSESADIPPVPPSTVRLERRDEVFGFTAPKIRRNDSTAFEEMESSPSLEFSDETIQPTGSEAESETITIPDPIDDDDPVPLPLTLSKKPVADAPVELDPSLFLVELFEDAALEIRAERTTPTTINGLTIQPWSMEGTARNLSSAMKPWPANGLPALPVIAPGPVCPKWTAEPVATRPANSRPRRLMIENSDSALRAIE